MAVARACSLAGSEDPEHSGPTGQAAARLRQSRSSTIVSWGGDRWRADFPYNAPGLLMQLIMLHE